MSVRKGADWGAPGPLEPGSAVVATDRAIVEAVLAPPTPGTRSWPADTPEIGLTGGDLHRTVGSPSHSASQLYQGAGMRLPVDIGEVHIDASQTPRYFSAHLVCTSPGVTRRSRALFAGHTLVVMNAAFMGTANLAPRAHPGDGRLDVTEGSLGLMDRIRAHRRLTTGTHVPHPGLAQRRTRQARFEFDSPLLVHLDGEVLGEATQLDLRCIPDALVIVV